MARSEVVPDMIPAAMKRDARFLVESKRSQFLPQTSLVVTGTWTEVSHQALPEDIDTPLLRRY